MKIYLDTSVYNRAFDDQTQPRIWLETLVLALSLQLVEVGEGDYLLIRKQLFAKETVKSLCQQIEEFQKAKTKK